MRPYGINGGFIGRTANYRTTESYLQYVGGLTSQSAGAAAGTRSISLAGISMLENDLVIVAYERTGTASKTATTISGYTTIAALYADNTTPTTGVDSNLIVAYKFMGATPDANLVIPTSGATTEAEAVAVQVWRGIDTVNPLDVTAVTATQTTTGIPNPPAITPVTTGAIIVVAAGTSHNGGTDTFTAAYLSNFLTVGGNSTTDATVGMGWLTWPGGAYDPAAWTFSQADSTSYASNSVTFALRPVSSNAKNSGVWSIPAEFNAKTLDVSGQQEYLATSGSFSFVVPENLYQLSAVAIGGGGGGGGWGSAGDEASGGGGGGALAYATFAVTPGETLTVNVGAAGNGGNGGNDGGNGGTSSVQRGGTNLVAAGGGQGGNCPDDGGNANGGPGGTVITGTGFAGGAGGNNTETTGAPAAGGGGAGGYTGAGGRGGGLATTRAGLAGTNSGAGGGAALQGQTAEPAATLGTGHGGGGGVGVFGTGTAGAAGVPSSLFLTVATIGTATFNGVTTTNVTGSGSGASFNVTQNAANNGYTVTLVSGGTGYSATAGSNTIRILGTSVGGATTANDITITITAISGSAISTFTIPAAGNTGNLSAGNAMATLTSTRGDATGGTGGPFTVTNLSAGVVVTNNSGGTSPSGTWSITVTRSGSVYTTAVTTGGTAFGTGDTIFIPYTLIGGAPQSGSGGSGGDVGTSSGGLYGGGGRGAITTNGSGVAGARGAVRLVWGFNRSFPTDAPSGITGAVAQLGLNYLPQIDNI